MPRTILPSGVDQSPVWLALRRPDHPAVLIVDRDSAIRTIYAEHLATMDCDVFATRDTDDPVQKAADLWPHVIVMDLVKADVMRWDTIVKLRQSSWTSGIRIIAVSDDADVRDEAFENGCDAFLVRPLTPSVLRAQIRTLIDPPESRSMRRADPIVPIRPAA
ncbi:MAG TPA: response regulator, partial [Vicinamibacterales bacterium]|nr:response regulator [Vicinamibacterales bacterium]